MNTRSSLIIKGVPARVWNPEVERLDLKALQDSRSLTSHRLRLVLGKPAG